MVVSCLYLTESRPHHSRRSRKLYSRRLNFNDFEILPPRQLHDQRIQGQIERQLAGFHPFINGQ
jgi:hypothetical protein